MTWATEITADSPAYWHTFVSASSNFYPTAGDLVTGILGANEAVSYPPTGPTAAIYYSNPGAMSNLQGGSAFTVDLVFKTNPSLTNQTVLFVQPAQHQVLSMLSVQSTGRVAWSLPGGSILSATGLVVADTWYLLSATFDGAGTARLYLNGAEVGTLAISTSAISAYYANGTDSAPSVPMFYNGGYKNPLSSGYLPDTLAGQDNITDELVVFTSDLGPTRIAAHNSALGLPPPAGVPESVDESAGIHLNTVPPCNASAVFWLSTTEAVDESAGIHLNTRAVDASAGIHLYTSEAVDESATINAVSIDATQVSRSHGKWSAVVLIDAVDYSARLTGTIEIEQSEDNSSLAFFTIIPVTGAVTPADYIGNRVQIDFIDISAMDVTLYQLTRFVGKISNPSYDPDTGTMFMECTTDLQGAIDKLTRTQIDAMTPTATWSPYVFDEGAQGWAYAQDRMRTIPASMWHSPSGVVVSNWAAKTTEDFEFTDADMFQCGPYEPGTSRDLLNTIYISYGYRYKRKRQRTVACKWRTLQTFCEFLTNGFTLCQKRMVEQAASSAGWTMQGEIQYVELPPAGYYRCFPFSIGPVSAKVIGWGDLQLGKLIEDADNEELCWGASWRASKRWLQTVTERYSITLTAAQSVAGNGEIASLESYSLEAKQDLEEWVKALEYSTANPVAAGYELVGGNIADGTYELGDVAKDATDDDLTGRTASNLARTVMIAAASSDILAAHRKNSAVIVAPFQPMVNLTHTVRADSAHITFKGKVASIRDTFDIDSGDAVSELAIALSRHEGTGLVTPSPLTPDSPPAKTTEEDIPTDIYMTTHIGGRNDVDVLDGTEFGYFTNWIYDPTETEPFATNPSLPDTIIYPEEFVVEYPEISGGAVDAIELPAAQNIDVEIPVDELTLTQ